MKRRKVIAKVVDPGQCRYYSEGREFELGGFTPEGLCDSAYAVLSRDAQTLAYGGKLPWERDGRVLTRCPDPEGALWELRCPESYQGPTHLGEEESADRQHPGSAETWTVKACRGRRGGCPCALADLGALEDGVNAAIADSDWEGFIRDRTAGRIRPHQRLRAALAACPNACTRPQVRDIGLIAAARPIVVGEECTTCGACREVCREGAIQVSGESAQLCGEACLACGQCARQCPVDAIAAEELSFRVLVGGRLGRHPRWAAELPGTVGAHQVPGVVRGLVAAVIRHAESGEALADTAHRLGSAALWDAAGLPAVAEKP